MAKSKSRRFGREFKLSALSRMAAGENVSALSRQLNVRRKLLYEWRDAFRAGGAEALRGPDRPPRGSLVLGAKSGGLLGWRDRPRGRLEIRRTRFRRRGAGLRHLSARLASRPWKRIF